MRSRVWGVAGSSSQPIAPIRSALFPMSVATLRLTVPSYRPR